MKHKILLVAANPSISTTTGWSVGFWASELTHPYFEFLDKGYEVDIASPNGGVIEMDGMSNPYHESGYAAADEISKKFIDNNELMDLLKETKKIEDVSVDDYVAIIVVGGQSPMFTFKNELNLHSKFLEFYKKGKVSSTLCHGSSLLLYLKENDQYFVKDKEVTGFSNAEEDMADKAMGQKLMPFRIEDEAVKLGAKFNAAEPLTPHVVKDRNLITGQQHYSGRVVARAIINELNRSLK
ncbi:MAG: type 1 glutamine amidotransferase domain-containing protein [Pseudobacteriovorax sp.]|nr:type 1 glutamine amidotransferase domain-containing protein [Pseudobacteriovorax sp.]